jgi:uncharacterized membrane protein YccF (DUF307 family)
VDLSVVGRSVVDISEVGLSVVSLSVVDLSVVDLLVVPCWQECWEMTAQDHSPWDTENITRGETGDRSQIKITTTATMTTISNIDRK